MTNFWATQGNKQNPVPVIQTSTGDNKITEGTPSSPPSSLLNLTEANDATIAAQADGTFPTLTGDDATHSYSTLYPDQVPAEFNSPPNALDPAEFVKWPSQLQLEYVKKYNIEAWQSQVTNLNAALENQDEYIQNLQNSLKAAEDLLSYLTTTEPNPGYSLESLAYFSEKAAEYKTELEALDPYANPPSPLANETTAFSELGKYLSSYLDVLGQEQFQGFDISFLTQINTLDASSDTTNAKFLSLLNELGFGEDGVLDATELATAQGYADQYEAILQRIGNGGDIPYFTDSEDVLDTYKTQADNYKNLLTILGYTTDEADLSEISEGYEIYNSPADTLTTEDLEQKLAQLIANGNDPFLVEVCKNAIVLKDYYDLYRYGRYHVLLRYKTANDSVGVTGEEYFAALYKDWSLTNPLDSDANPLNAIDSIVTKSQGYAAAYGALAPTLHLGSDFSGAVYTNPPTQSQRNDAQTKAQEYNLFLSTNANDSFFTGNPPNIALNISSRPSVEGLQNEKTALQARYDYLLTLDPNDYATGYIDGLKADYQRALELADYKLATLHFTYIDFLSHIPGKEAADYYIIKELVDLTGEKMGFGDAVEFDYLADNTALLASNTLKLGTNLSGTVYSDPPTAAQIADAANKTTEYNTLLSNGSLGAFAPTVSTSDPIETQKTQLQAHLTTAQSIRTLITELQNSGSPLPAGQPATIDAQLTATQRAIALNDYARFTRNYTEISTLTRVQESLDGDPNFYDTLIEQAQARRDILAAQLAQAQANLATAQTSDIPLATSIVIGPDDVPYDPSTHITVVFSGVYRTRLYIVEQLQKNDFSTMPYDDQVLIAETEAFQGRLDPNPPATTPTALRGLGETFDLTPLAGQSIEEARNAELEKLDNAATFFETEGTRTSMPAKDIEIFTQQLDLIKRQIGQTDADKRQAIFSSTQIEEMITQITTRFNRAAAFSTIANGPAPTVDTNYFSSEITNGYIGVVSTDNNATIISGYKKFIAAEEKILKASESALNIAFSGQAPAGSGFENKKMDMPQLIAYYQLFIKIRLDAEVEANLEEINQQNALLRDYALMQQVLNEGLQKMENENDSYNLSGSGQSTSASDYYANDPKKLAALYMFEERTNAGTLHPIEIMKGNYARPLTTIIAGPDDNSPSGDGLVSRKKSAWTTFGTRLTDAVNVINQETQIKMNDINSLDKEQNRHFELATNMLNKASDLIQKILAA